MLIAANDENLRFGVHPTNALYPPLDDIDHFAPGDDPRTHLKCHYASSAKQRCFMPGSKIPILPPNELLEHRPDYVLILPWNIAEEVTAQLASLASMGTQFVIAVPELRVACTDRY